MRCNEQHFQNALLHSVAIFKGIGMSYIDSLLPVDKARYLRKLNSIGIDICPYDIKDWTDSLFSMEPQAMFSPTIQPDVTFFG